MCRKRVIFSGRVQGVGFRYTTQSIARRYPVSGFVRNLSDGTVELEAQGDGRSVDDFLAEIGRSFEGNVRDRDVTELPAEESSSESGFSIRY